jgi:hypothetical protein
MPEAAGVLTHWESFYVIVGSSAGALTGLQFVVMALIAETRPDANFGQIDAFGSPTIVHFCVVLLISAILSSPWPSISGPAITLGMIAISGLVYTTIVLRRTLRVEGYKPVLEDWLWHITFPFVAYAGFLIAAFTLAAFSTVSLFIVGAMNLLLLFVGIHNAWDTVTFIVVTRPKPVAKRVAEPAPQIEAPASE